MFGTGKINVKIVDVVSISSDKHSTKQSMFGLSSRLLKDKAYYIGLRRQIMGDDDDGIDEEMYSKQKIDRLKKDLMSQSFSRVINQKHSGHLEKINSYQPLLNTVL